MMMTQKKSNRLKMEIQKLNHLEEKERDWGKGSVDEKEGKVHEALYRSEGKKEL